MPPKTTQAPFESVLHTLANSMQKCDYLAHSVQGRDEDAPLLEELRITFEEACQLLRQATKQLRDARDSARRSA